jgi:hypothetical protein
MSEAIEAVVVRQPAKAITPLLATLEGVAEPDHVRVVPLLEDVSLIYWVVPERRSFGGHANHLASLLSARMGRSVLFRYDSGTCYRYSARYEEGELAEEFNLDDELWVELNDEGDPDPARGVFTNREFEKGTEYETQKNAVQLGLDTIGFADWKGLLSRISRL